MSKKIFVCLAILCCAALGAPVSAQDGSSPAEVLTNDKIVTMTKAGLPSNVIVNKIRMSKTDFDLSTEELVRLKQEQVPDEIINVMLNPVAAPVGPSEAGSYPKEIGVYWKQNSEWIEVPSEVVNWKTGGVMKSIASLGVVKTDVNGHIEGHQSRTRIGSQIEFVVVA